MMMVGPLPRAFIVLDLHENRTTMMITITIIVQDLPHKGQIQMVDPLGQIQLGALLHKIQ